MADRDPSWTEVGNDVRLDPTTTTVVAIGLLLVAVAAVLASIVVWRSGSPPPAGAPSRSPLSWPPPALRVARRADRLGAYSYRRGPVACHCTVACFRGRFQPPRSCGSVRRRHRQRVGSGPCLAGSGARRTFPTGASVGLVTSPSRSKERSGTFIVCRVTNATRTSSEFDRHGRWANSSRQAYPERPQHVFDGRTQSARRLLRHVAQRLVEVDPDFISLQGCDLDAAQAFDEHYLGLVRSPTPMATRSRSTTAPDGRRSDGRQRQPPTHSALSPTE